MEVIASVVLGLLVLGIYGTVLWQRVIRPRMKRKDSLTE